MSGLRDDVVIMLPTISRFHPLGIEDPHAHEEYAAELINQGPYIQHKRDFGRYISSVPAMLCALDIYSDWSIVFIPSSGVIVRNTEQLDRAQDQNAVLHIF